MKLLFLDLDGVLTDFNAVKISEKLNIPCGFNLNACEHIREIVNTTKCKIVISSDWRNYYSFDEMCTIFNYYSLPNIFGFTPNLPSYNGLSLDRGRAEEILNFVKVYKPSRYCAVDDLNLDILLDKNRNFVKTVDIIEEKHKNKIIKLLNAE